MTTPDAARRPPAVFPVLLGLVAVGLLTALYWVFGVAPVEARMGLIQKIFYFHVPAAIAMYLGFVLCGIGSLVFLLRRAAWGDALAVAGAQVGLAFGGMVLLTGPLWAKGTWGAWWVWDDPQLTTTLLLVLVYTTYLFLRRFLGEQPGSRRLPAVLAAIGLLDIPVIHYSVRLWRGQHPQVIRGGGGGLAPEMLQALLISMVTFLLLAALLIWLRYRLERARQCIEELRLDLLERHGDDAFRTQRPATAGLVGLLLVGLVTLGATTSSPAWAQVPGAPAPQVAPAPDKPARLAEPAPDPAVAPSAAPAPALTPAAAAAPPAAQMALRPTPQRTLAGGTLMVVAYALIWLLTLAVVLHLWRKQRHLDAELRELQRQIHPDGR